MQHISTSVHSAIRIFSLSWTDHPYTWSKLLRDKIDIKQKLMAYSFHEEKAKALLLKSCRRPAIIACRNTKLHLCRQAMLRIEEQVPPRALHLAPLDKLYHAFTSTNSFLQRLICSRAYAETFCLVAATIGCSGMFTSPP